MLLLLMLLPLGTLLHQTLGKNGKPMLSDSPEKTQKEILDTINHYRRNVKPTASNMLKVTWTNEGAKTAKTWASKCVLRSSPEQFRTVNGTVCGETMSDAKVARPWKEILENWHRTQSFFKFGVGPTNSEENIYSYTQLVWYRSHMIGCAAAYCPDNNFPVIYVCHYCPGGNTQEENFRPYNQGPSCRDCPNNCENKLCTNPCMYTDKTPICNEIMATLKCKTKLVEYCQATCNCKTEIK